jgi:hypothetical protein
VFVGMRGWAVPLARALRSLCSEHFSARSLFSVLGREGAGEGVGG